MERQATSARKPPRLAPPALDEEFATEQMDPQILVGFDFEVPLADGDEDHLLRDGVRGEVVKLYPVVVAEHADESADGDAEPPLVQTRQTHNIAAWGFGIISDPSAIHSKRTGSVIAGSCPAATSVSKYGTSAINRPQGTGSSILTGLTMATVEGNVEGEA